MNPGHFLRLVLGILFAFMVCPASASAHSGPACHANALAGESYATLARQSERWDCDNSGWSITSPATILRFELSELDQARPAFLSTRLTRFESMELTVIGRDGRSATRRVTEAEMTPATSDWLMTTNLPRLDSDIARVVVTVKGVRHTGMLSAARLVTDLDREQGNLPHELLIAALCGLLFAPLILNLAFYWVLRERFLLWHTLAVVFMVVQTVVTSGLVNRFADLSVTQLCWLSGLSWGGGIAAASLFLADMIEPGKLEAGQRRVLHLMAPWVLAWSLFYLTAGGSWRAIAEPLYFLSFVPVLVSFIWVMGIASHRGSRAVRFQIAAWLPLMLIGTIRIASTMGLTGAPLELQIEQHVSLALEVIITAIGVTDRFMIMRRQRDRAQARARLFEDRAERDSLTGLLNRRGMEERFTSLYAEGFRTMAVIDLDRFKAVNDTHGHGTGDEVLKAVAAALEPDDSTCVVRMGGEEFLLLLKGRDVVARAERRRQAIAVRVAAAVPGLQQVVTASMGLVQHPAGKAISADFHSLYAHCDRLLYEAKAAGRNRTMRERVQSFGLVREEEAA